MAQVEGFKQTITEKLYKKLFITIGNNLNSGWNTDKKVVEVRADLVPGQEMFRKD